MNQGCNISYVSNSHRNPFNLNFITYSSPRYLPAHFCTSICNVSLCCGRRSVHQYRNLGSFLSQQQVISPYRLFFLLHVLGFIRYTSHSEWYQPARRHEHTHIYIYCLSITPILPLFAPHIHIWRLWQHFPPKTKTNMAPVKRRIILF